MKKNLLYILLPTVMILTCGGCKKYDGSKAESDREKWIESLHDSIAFINKARAEDSLKIEKLREEITADMTDFTQVANQREVEPYYIMSASRSQYPLTSTGIIARITNDLQFEVIAALSGQQFDAIRIRKSGNDGSEVTSTVVPPDQGLNYTSNDGLTVVAFSGPLNSALGKFVAENSKATLSVEYLMKGATRKSIVIPDARKECIAASWRLTDCRARLDSLENIQIINARKLEILHITLKRRNESPQQNVEN